MANKNIEVKGLNNVLDMLDAPCNPKNIKQSLQTACALVERTAKQKAPKDTGALRRSITSKVEGNIGKVYTPLEYAPYVECGTGLFAEKGGRKRVPWHYKNDKGEWVSTSGQKPQPFLRPALKENQKQITQILKGGLTNKK